VVCFDLDGKNGLWPPRTSAQMRHGLGAPASSPKILNGRPRHPLVPEPRRAGAVHHQAVDKDDRAKPFGSTTSRGGKRVTMFG